MEKILEILQAKNAGNVSKQAVKEAMISNGLSEDAELTNEQAFNIANKIITSKTKTSIVKSPKRKRKQRQLDINESLQIVAQKSSEEIQAFKDTLVEGSNAYAAHVAQEIVSELADTPSKVVEKVGELAQDAEADPDKFREIAQGLSTNLFPIASSGIEE